MMREAFANVNEDRMSAHSLRKKLQTYLEKAGINSNWIDQILGHQLINSRDAYSLPTDEELNEAYTKAYQFIRVYPEIKTSLGEISQPTPPILIETSTKGEENYLVAEAKNMEQIKALLAKGYKYEMDFEGKKFSLKNNKSLF
jgi:hypothetical protein